VAGDTFDAKVTAAIRRFQSRHGLEETGTVGQRTLAAMNVPVSQRLRQLAASLDRLSQIDFTFGQRYVVVNIPAAFVEAVENNRVVRRHAVIVGKRERPSPTLTTQLTAVNLNPTWTVPLGILKKDIRPKMRRDPQLQCARRGSLRHAQSARGLSARHQQPLAVQRRLPFPVVGLRARGESA
jgi:murein L,D-transpeptidase YcbB/YkuD